MSIAKEHEKEFARFPAVLRELVTAELAAGNEIAEFAHGFPAAPCGACIKLAHAVTSRPRVATPELDFYDRNGSGHSGEFTDAKRHFFVLEPPRPPELPPDMDAIRAELNARHAAANRMPATPSASPEPGHQPAGTDQNPKSALARFKASMEIDYEKWHDGIGYDLSLLREATPDELQAIEDILIQRRSSDWRDVEALAALNTKTAQEALKDAFIVGDTKVRMAVQSHAPELLTEQQRTDSLVRALQESETYGGLTQALLEVQDFHPTEVIRALLRGLMERDGATAVHFAAMLHYLHGKASEPFDWEQRPFFLRFNTDDRVEREKACRELCATIGVDPQCCIKPIDAMPPAKTI